MTTDTTPDTPRECCGHEKCCRKGGGFEAVPDPLRRELVAEGDVFDAAAAAVRMGLPDLSEEGSRLVVRIVRDAARAEMEKRRWR